MEENETMGRLLFQRALLLVQEEEEAEATEHFRMASEQFEQTPNALMLGLCKMNLAALYRKSGDTASAFFLYEQAERLFQATGDPTMLAEARKQLQQLLSSEEPPTEAAEPADPAETSPRRPWWRFW